MNIRKILHEKRLKTEDHIRELESAGKAGERCTATMPDIPFLILALLCDIGWIIQLIAVVLLGDPWVAVGGFLNLVAGLPLYLSFKPGIRYGIQ